MFPCVSWALPLPVSVCEAVIRSPTFVFPVFNRILTAAARAARDCDMVVGKDVRKPSHNHDEVLM